MKAIVTVEEMRAIDARSKVATEVLIARAGFAVARAAKAMLGGTYGRRVVVVAGKGNNGADGRVAARLLTRQGVRVQIFEPDDVPMLPPCDLVIDAAFGTGFHGEYTAPDPGGAPVLAVDIPSGINGDTGEACRGAVRATRTVTFGAFKPGHLLGEGPDRCGTIELADIGLDVSGARMALLEDADVRSRLMPRPRNTHKWHTAVAVVAGSPGMLGAAMLCSQGAMRAGAGMVRLVSPGVHSTDLPASEAVAVEVPATHWDAAVLNAAERTHAVVIGPGLGRNEHTVACARAVISKAPGPLVADADVLYALAQSGPAQVIERRLASTVLTPHDGEFESLVGHPPSARRYDDAGALAIATQAVVLLKGSTTIVAAPSGELLFTNTGSARLATAGTGDVLAGIIGALLADGLDSGWAAAIGAYVHGAAARLGYERGLIASDLPEYVAQWLDENCGLDENCATPSLGV